MPEPSKDFFIEVRSWYDRNDADVIHSFRSQRPEKRLAELTLLECAFLHWSRKQREALSVEVAASKT
jgi:hypothetical protein